MPFYDHSKTQRQKIVESIGKEILAGLRKRQDLPVLKVFSDQDTYIRKAGYLSVGKIYSKNKDLGKSILSLLNRFMVSQDQKIRQTAINAAGEIGKTDFGKVKQILEIGFHDEHHAVRNAVIGSLKKMGEKNPGPVLVFVQKFLFHEDKEIRRQVCHGLELRGRTHPHEVLPLLKQLQDDQAVRVRTTLIHVLGQISYKKGCLETVITHLKTWNNTGVVEKALHEIIDVHGRYKKFSSLTRQQAKEYIETHFYA